MKNPILWCALVLGLISVGVSAESALHAPKAEAAAVVSPRVSCEPVTGSRLPPPRNAQGECETNPAFGRAYTQEDLERTGSVGVAEALRKLDAGLR